MTFLDTLHQQSAGWLTNFAPQIIDSGLKKTGLIKVAAPPKSNLTAKQVKSGEKGTISQLHSKSSNGVPWGMIAAGFAALIAIIFVIKRK